jgi:hypothetical protein
MTQGPLILVVLSALALLLVPRRWAPLPFIAVACYLSVAQAVNLGPFTFTAIRILIAIGFIRILVRGERLTGGIYTLDWLMLAWAAWVLFSGLFRSNFEETLINRLGWVYGTLGIYFLIRIFCTSVDDVIGLCRVIAILLVPIGLAMMYELSGSPSLFYVFEGSPNQLYIREGQIRAYGPFMHPILAGTVGAVCLPLVIGLWRHSPAMAFAGTTACLAMVVSSASSGPVMSMLTSLAGLAMWPLRRSMRAIRWGSFAALLVLSVVMNAPIYFLIARVDIVGGSTGWHRSLLIDSAIKYIDEWWAIGTDYTRHWAPSPGPTSQHTDITNQYLSMGIAGGLPLMVLFIAIIVYAFAAVGRRLHHPSTRPEHHMMLWALGCALFAHATTFLSVTYFDQSYVFLYLTIGAIGATSASALVASPIAASADAASCRAPGMGRTSVPVSVADCLQRGLRHSTARPRLGTSGR